MIDGECECGSTRFVTKNGRLKCWVARQEQRQRSGVRKKPHGLTIPQAKDLREWSKTCDICGRPNSAVDHDHGTGAIRGTLCPDCNRRMAAVDDKEWMAKALEYKERSSPYHRIQ